MLYYKYYIITEYSTVNPEKPTIQWIYTTAQQLARHLDINKSTVYKVLKRGGLFGQRGALSRFNKLIVSRTNDVDLSQCNMTQEGVYYKSEIYA